jgi:pimeloyl-ACP methyl ester carboxylesterase
MLTRVDSDTVLDYQVYGEAGGDPVLVITGTSLSWLLWNDFAKALAAEGYRLICYDHRGIGASTRGSSEITMSTLAADAAALLDALGIERAHVLGWSLGSCVAQELAITDPGRVKSLILANTWQRTDGYQRALFTTFRHLWSTGDADIAWTAQSAASFSPELLDSPAFGQVMSGIAPALPRTQIQRETVVEQWSADLAHDTESRLPSIASPTLVVTGEQDLVTPARQGQAVAEAIPGAQLEGLRGPGASHALAWERQEEFVRTVVGFLSRQS